MEFRILGPLQVFDGDRPVEIAGSKRRAVLALLLLHANEVVRTERLVDEIWGEEAPRNAAAALHNHVSRLRKALGPDVLARREWGYVLRVDEDAIDLHRFQELVAAAEAKPARERSAMLAEALKLWRGPALADLVAEPGLRSEAARLDELRLTTQERRIDADLEAGRNGELVGEIEALIAANPLREHLRWQLILALYRAGRQAEALEVYRETRRVLSEELGLEPSRELRELEKAILRQDPTIESVPQPRALAGSPQRPKRRSLLLALVALGLIGLGLGAASTLRGSSHRTMRAAQTGLRKKDARVTTASSTTTYATSTRVVHDTRAQHNRARVVVARKRTQRRAHHHATSQIAAAAQAHTGTGTTRTATNPTGTQTSKPRVVTISDSFDGNQIDSTIWYQIRSGTGWTLSQQDRHLEFAFPTGATPGGQYDSYGGQVGTLCKFPGDFDARVSFTLVDWPPANFMNVGLWIFGNGLGWSSIRLSTPQWGEQYSAYLGQGRGGSISLDDQSGTVRLARRKGVITAYFLHKGQWTSFGSAFNNSTATLAVSASSQSNAPARSDQVVVDFDNFSVTAVNPICPAGAQGSM